MGYSEIEDVVAIFHDSSSIVALTGAGISVPSDIPDFRGEKGLWRRYDPDLYATYNQFCKDPSYFWEMHLEIMKSLHNAVPNAAHRSLVTLERNHFLKGIITQNIDGLHQKAGSTVVYELHGSAESCSCIACGTPHSMQDIASHLFSFNEENLISLMRSGKEIPRCECGGFIKPDVVLFGEMMPMKTVHAAEALAQSCDLLLVIGSSLYVQPAASIPLLAQRAGSILVIINKDPGLLDSCADSVLLGDAEKILPRIVAEL
jgi:NAD-dependent deacetylase